MSGKHTAVTLRLSFGPKEMLCFAVLKWNSNPQFLSNAEEIVFNLAPSINKFGYTGFNFGLCAGKRSPCRLRNSTKTEVSSDSVRVTNCCQLADRCFSCDWQTICINAENNTNFKIITVSYTRHRPYSINVTD